MVDLYIPEIKDLKVQQKMKRETPAGGLAADVKHLDQTVKIVILLLIAIVVAAIFALGAIWNDYLAMKQASYSDLRDKVIEQNYRIDTLSNDLKGAKYIYLSK